MPDSSWCARLMPNCVFTECSKIHPKILNDIIAIFGVIGQNMLTQEIPECPFPTLTRNGQLKKYAELFEKKVRVMVEEVCVGGGGRKRGAGYVFLQSWFEDGRSRFQPWPPGLWPGEGACYPVWYRCLTKTTRKDTFLRTVSCAALSSFRVRKIQFL